MCTVSFIPVKNKVFITSNRDEKHWRLPAQPPMNYSFKNCEMIFPKDGEAGGTWISLCNNGNTGILLNGAFTMHERKKNYAKSRGLVFLDIMDNARPLHAFLKNSLLGIEPFTLILWQQNNLYECRWDANERKHCLPLKNFRPYIWSSSTLYDDEIRKKRELWFAKWLNQYPAPTKDEILKFHHFAGDGDKKNDLSMNRDGKVFTVSITNIEFNAQGGIMNYTDVISKHKAEAAFAFSNHLIAA